MRIVLVIIIIYNIFDNSNLKIDGAKFILLGEEVSYQELLGGV
jgi:hypothetical protein